eukprot:521802_1
MMKDEQQYLNYVNSGYYNSNHTYGSIQQATVPHYPKNFRHYYYNHNAYDDDEDAHILYDSHAKSQRSRKALNTNKKPKPKTKPRMHRLSMVTKIVVPYYMLTLFMTILALILYFVIPFGNAHKVLFSVIVFATIFGACVGCLCSWKWSAIYKFKDLLVERNKEWKQSISSLSKTKTDLKVKVRTMEFSVDTLAHSAADLEITLSQFKELKSQLQKLTTKSQQVTDVLDGLLNICNDLTRLIREHAKTELMVAYYDAAVFASRGRESISLSSHKWRTFRARLDSETRRVFDDSGGFDAIPRDQYDRVDIHDLEK